MGISLACVKALPTRRCLMLGTLTDHSRRQIEALPYWHPLRCQHGDVAP